LTIQISGTTTEIATEAPCGFSYQGDDCSETVEIVAAMISLRDFGFDNFQRHSQAILVDIAEYLLLDASDLMWGVPMSSRRRLEGGVWEVPLLVEVHDSDNNAMRDRLNHESFESEVNRAVTSRVDGASATVAVSDSDYNSNWEIEIILTGERAQVISLEANAIVSAVRDHTGAAMGLNEHIVTPERTERNENTAFRFGLMGDENAIDAALDSCEDWRVLEMALRQEVGLSEIKIVDIATPQLSPRSLECELDPTNDPGMTKIPTSSPTDLPSKAPATGAAGAAKGTSTDNDDETFVEENLTFIMIGIVGLLLCLILMMMYLLCQRSKDSVMVLGSNLEMQNYHDTIDHREDPVLGNIMQTHPYERERKREPTPRRGGREVPARLGYEENSNKHHTGKLRSKAPKNVVSASSRTYDRELSGLYKTAGYTPSTTAEFSYHDATSDGYRETNYTIAPANDNRMHTGGASLATMSEGDIVTM